MKKSKTFKSVALVGLSAVMASGVAMAAAGCGGGGGGGSTANNPNIIVSMFSSNADKATNQKIADDWAKEYNEKSRVPLAAARAPRTAPSSPSPFPIIRARANTSTSSATSSVKGRSATSCISLPVTSKSMRRPGACSI